MRTPFHFKEFTVYDRQSAMKLSTDAVLLGAWTNISGSKRILDIGTGCGVIALMLAQRSKALIDAVDIHSPSITEATENFRMSLWESRLKSIHSDVLKFSETTTHKYDLIVSNPPFFTNSLKSPKESVNISKHNDVLSFDDLIKSVGNLLDQNGRFSVILPANNLKGFDIKARLSCLFPIRQTLIYPKREKEANRILIEYSPLKSETTLKTSLIIREKNNSYSDEYIQLTRDFYLGL
ncbi:MAG: methyltransferase [Bacteroidales bacterium]|nr:methyltransferase [Bacteroidales bacterium]